MATAAVIAVSVGCGLMLAAAPVAMAADSGLYVEMGGKDGLSRIAGRMLQIVTKDPRTARQFDNINLDWLQNRLTLYFCRRTGGPCAYPGRDMHDAHAGLHLATREFNALVENLQLAMDQEGVPFPMQNRFLAIFAPLQRDIVTR